jgi:hypothetical protein
MTPMCDTRIRHNTPVIRSSDHLFAWRGAGIVLLCERAGENWVVARGWTHDDELTDVRRWTFPTQHRFAIQVSRLVREATGEESDAAEAQLAAREWAESAVRVSDVYF